MEVLKMSDWVHVSGVIRINYFRPNEKKKVIREEIKKCVPIDFIKNNPYSVKIKIDVVNPKIVPKVNISINGDFSGVLMDDVIEWIEQMLDNITAEDKETKHFGIRSCVFLFDDESSKVVITDYYDKNGGWGTKYIDV